MRESEINSKLKQAFEKSVPDVLESVLSDCSEEKGQVITMNSINNSKRKFNWTKRATALAACLLVFIGGAFGFGFYYSENYKVASIISLDVNPSIQITANRKEKVIDVKALNEDAEIVIGDMDFKNSDLDIAVNAIIGSMLRNGYLNELANSILISVDGSDQAESEKLQARLTEEINSLLQTETFSGAVLSQTVAADKELSNIAEQYGITVGKARLIQEIMKYNTRYTFEGLVPLSINELNLLMESANILPESIESVGTASSKAYIDKDSASDIALSHAGISDISSVYKFETELDTEDGLMVYEIDFAFDGYEYEYEIDALTGNIIKNSKEKDDEYKFTNPQNGQDSSSTGNIISEADAKSAALSHAAVSESDITNYKIKQDRDDGIYVYEIEFDSNGYEYDYEVNASNGNIVKNSKEKLDNYQFPSSSQNTQASTSNDNLISEADAKSAALSHAAVSEADITNYKIKQDRDDGIYVYEIEFNSNGYEYDYEINASNGTIRDWEKDRRD